MGRGIVSWIAARTSRSIFLAVVFFCAIAVGCDHTCVIFVSNPSDVSISTNTATCSVNTVANATVRVRLFPARTNLAMPSPVGVKHIFVTLRGIAIRVAASTAEAPPEWQQLAPDLVRKPMQIDLLSNMDRTSSMDRSPSLILSVGTEVPAGAFGQVSLLLMPDTPTEAEPVPEKNACAGVGFNCVVAADGGIRPLIVTGRSQILIPASQIEGGLLSVLPETMTDLDLELSSRSSLTYTPGSALWFDPVFTARSDPSASAPR